MANSKRGEIAMDIEGVTYTLVLDTNAMVTLEDLFSTPQREVTFDQVLQRVVQNSVRHIRGLIWAMLRRHHPEVTVEQAGDLITKAGGLAAMAAQIEAATGAAQPDPADLQTLGVKGNPRAAQARKRGTGGRSSATPGAPA